MQKDCHEDNLDGDESNENKRTKDCLGYFKANFSSMNNEVFIVGVFSLGLAMKQE